MKYLSPSYNVARTRRDRVGTVHLNEQHGVQHGRKATLAAGDAHIRRSLFRKRG
jgi:hypothetical protein